MISEFSNYKFLQRTVPNLFTFVSPTTCSMSDYKNCRRKICMYKVKTERTTVRNGQINH
jgi:hypothetical protein